MPGSVPPAPIQIVDAGVGNGRTARLAAIVDGRLRPAVEDHLAFEAHLTPAAGGTLPPGSTG